MIKTLAQLKQANHLVSEYYELVAVERWCAADQPVEIKTCFVNESNNTTIQVRGGHLLPFIQNQINLIKAKLNVLGVEL